MLIKGATDLIEWSTELQAIYPERAVKVITAGVGLETQTRVNELVIVDSWNGLLFFGA